MLCGRRIIYTQSLAQIFPRMGRRPFALPHQVLVRASIVDRLEVLLTRCR